MELFERAKEIRNETKDDTNTSWRVGSLLMDMVLIINENEKKYSVANTVSMFETIENNELVLYNGTLWRGLGECESIYDEYTPWPVVGYKEIILRTYVDGDGGLSTFDLIKDDLAFTNITLIDGVFILETNVLDSNVFFVSGKMENSNTPYIFNSLQDSTSDIIQMGVYSTGSSSELLLGSIEDSSILWNIKIYLP